MTDARADSAAVAPFTVQRIDHVVLRVQDLERSVAFYRRMLGCEVARRRDDLGLVHLRAGASMIDLISVQGTLGERGGAAPGREGKNMDHLCLRIEPFDETSILAFLASAGVSGSPRAQMNFGAEGDGPSIYFSDPDGNPLELKGPPVRARAGIEGQSAEAEPATASRAGSA